MIAVALGPYILFSAYGLVVAYHWQNSKLYFYIGYVFVEFICKSILQLADDINSIRRLKNDLMKFYFRSILSC